MKNKFCIIISLSAPWYNHPRKHFFEAIAETIEKHSGFVLCLEPTILSVHTLFRYPERMLDWMRGRYKFRKADRNIYVVPAHTIEHILLSVRFKPLMSLNNIILKRQLRKLLSKIDEGIKDIILMLHRPELYYLVDSLGERGVIYDCCDDYNLTSQMNNLKVLGNQKREKILAEKSSFIVASSDLLYQRNLQYNPNTFMMENGFSRKLFHESRNGTVPSDISLLKKPIVGYIGNLKHWLDYELIDYIISKKPEWTFLFVGEVRKEGKKEFSNLLRKHKNIYSTGWIHYRYFPLYLKQFDVGIIPFNTNAFMESANPNKLYDYMGAGVPVVATSIGDLKKKYSYFVKVAQTKEDFLGYLETILNMPADERQALRSKILSLSEGHSWEDDAEFLFEKMKEYLLK